MGEIRDVVLRTEGRELPHRLAVGTPGIGIAEMGREEVA
jgi:hypothetical protein